MRLILIQTFSHLDIFISHMQNGIVLVNNKGIYLLKHFLVSIINENRPVIIMSTDGLPGTTGCYAIGYSNQINTSRLTFDFRSCRFIARGQCVINSNPL